MVSGDYHIAGLVLEALKRGRYLAGQLGTRLSLRDYYAGTRTCHNSEGKNSILAQTRGDVTLVLFYKKKQLMRF